MKTARDVVPHHEQKHENSCVAWGLELLLKLHEKIGLHDYPLQNGNDPTGWGFGQKERDFLMQKYGLAAKEDSFDLASFETNAADESKKGLPLIFSILDHIVIDPKNQKAFPVFHIWTAVLENNGLNYLSRGFGSNQVLDYLPLPQIYHGLSRHIPNYKIHSLLHS